MFLAETHVAEKMLRDCLRDRLNRISVDFNRKIRQSSAILMLFVALLLLGKPVGAVPVQSAMAPLTENRRNAMSVATKEDRVLYPTRIKVAPIPRVDSCLPCFHEQRSVNVPQTAPVPRTRSQATRRQGSQSQERENELVVLLKKPQLAGPFLGPKLIRQSGYFHALGVNIDNAISQQPGAFLHGSLASFDPSVEALRRTAFHGTSLDSSVTALRNLIQLDNIELIPDDQVPFVLTVEQLQAPTDPYFDTKEFPVVYFRLNYDGTWSQKYGKSELQTMQSTTEHTPHFPFTNSLDQFSANQDEEGLGYPDEFFAPNTILTPDFESIQEIVEFFEFISKGKLVGFFRVPVSFRSHARRLKALSN